MPTTYIPFQSTKAVTQMVALNAVEEWTIVNMNNIRHPFHIHVNPMYIVAVNGKRLASRSGRTRCRCRSTTIRRRRATDAAGDA